MTASLIDHKIKKEVPRTFYLTNNKPDHNTRTAPFTFNQEKQTKYLQKDAKSLDYEVLVNNNGENCNIRCSSGFYVAVARPFFSSLVKGSVLHCSNVAITLFELTVTSDKSGYEATRILKFSLMNNQTNLGRVTVHIHHSSRKLHATASAIGTTT